MKGMWFGIIILGIVIVLLIFNIFKTNIFNRESNMLKIIYSIVMGQFQYRATHTTYANLTQLIEAVPPYVEPDLINSSKKKGYIIYSEPVKDKESEQFIITAVSNILAPIFYSDEDGIICRSKSPNVSLPIGHYDDRSCPIGFSEVK